MLFENSQTDLMNNICIVQNVTFQQPNNIKGHLVCVCVCGNGQIQAKSVHTEAE